MGPRVGERARAIHGRHVGRPIGMSRECGRALEITYGIDLEWNSPLALHLCMVIGRSCQGHYVTPPLLPRHLRGGSSRGGLTQGGERVISTFEEGGGPPLRGGLTLGSRHEAVRCEGECEGGFGGECGSGHVRKMEPYLADLPLLQMATCAAQPMLACCRVPSCSLGAPWNATERPFHSSSCHGR